MQQKRDLDLIRELLLGLEAGQEVDLSAYDQQHVFYNIYLIIDARLADGVVTWGIDSYGKRIPHAASLSHLTWAGQDFLASARNSEVWRKATGEVARKGLDVSLDVLKALLSAYIRQQLGLP